MGTCGSKHAKSRYTRAQICAQHGVTDTMVIKLGVELGVEVPDETDLHWWMSNRHPMAQEAQKTFDDLFSIPYPHTDCPIQTREEFFELNPEWLTTNAYVWKQKRIIQRVLPENGCSFLHAAIVAQYYNSLLIPVEMRRFAMEKMNPKVLACSICHSGSSSSKHVFAHMLGHNDLDSTCELDRVEACLICYGPGVVSEFRLEPSLQNSARTLFEGTFNSNFGQHAMVVVGIRRDSAGKRFVLLQTCWARKPWIECDEDYFASAGATVYFSKRKAENLLYGNDNQYDECRLSAQDRMPEEA